MAEFRHPEPQPYDVVVWEVFCERPNLPIHRIAKRAQDRYDGP